jgi:hypothetical protein
MQRGIHADAQPTDVARVARYLWLIEREVHVKDQRWRMKS